MLEGATEEARARDLDARGRAGSARRPRPSRGAHVRHVARDREAALEVAVVARRPDDPRVHELVELALDLDHAGPRRPRRAGAPRARPRARARIVSVRSSSSSWRYLPKLSTGSPLAGAAGHRGGRWDGRSWDEYRRGRPGLGRRGAGPPRPDRSELWPPGCAATSALRVGRRGRLGRRRAASRCLLGGSRRRSAATPGARRRVPASAVATAAFWASGPARSAAAASSAALAPIWRATGAACVAILRSAPRAAPGHARAVRPVSLVCRRRPVVGAGPLRTGLGSGRRSIRQPAPRRHRSWARHRTRPTPAGTETGSCRPSGTPRCGGPLRPLRSGGPPWRVNQPGTRGAASTIPPPRVQSSDSGSTSTPTAVQAAVEQRGRGRAAQDEVEPPAVRAAGDVCRRRPGDRRSAGAVPSPAPAAGSAIVRGLALRRVAVREGRR